MDIGVMREERNKGSYNSRENNQSLFPFGGIGEIRLPIFVFETIISETAVSLPQR